MRIGLLAPPWLPVPPAAYGGTEAVLDTLARGLVAAGHDVLLWTVGESTCPAPRGSLLETAQTGPMGDVTIEVHHVLAGYEAFDRWGADVVHDHTVVGPLVAANGSLPIVTTNHGPFDAAAVARLRACAPSVAVVAISTDQASRAGDVPVAAVIHHGVDLERYPAGAGEGDERGEYVVYLGRMANEKGPATAADVARRAGMRLVIAAKMHSAAETAYFEREVVPLLGPDITYVGEVGHVEKVRLLRGASALVNPIAWPEPFGLAMVEALACGTPVVATCVGSVPEIVDDGVTGYVCACPDEMVGRLRALRLLDRQACRRAATDRFGATRMVRDHLALYERVSGRIGAPRASAGAVA
jgi:glycosyltransferase involved in cell wall biosynthesis